MHEAASTVPRVHLDRFCTRCGRYEVRVALPPPPPKPGQEREQWMEAQKRKAMALRGTPSPESWVCRRCGCDEAKAAGTAHAAAPQARVTT